MIFDKRYFTIFIIQVTEVLGFSLILPFLPFYAQTFGATPLQIGLILTSFSIFQFLSAPIMGKLSDHYGRRPLLVFSQLSTFLGFIILGFADSLWMIYLSRIVDGMLGSNYTIAQAYLSDISSKKERSMAFGISGVAFGVGFLVGPAIGGLLAKIDYSIPAFIAAGMSFLTIVITLLFLPETVKQRKDLKIDMKMFHMGDFRKYFNIAMIRYKLWEFSAFILAHVVFVSTLALYAERQLGFDTGAVGLLLAYVGFISVVLRGVLLGKLIDLFGEQRLLDIGMLSMFLGLLLAGFINRGWMMFVVMTFFASGSGVARPLLMGAISKRSHPKEQGAVMGITNSLGSLAQIIGPLIGGAIINYMYPGFLGIAAAAIVGSALLLLLKEKTTYPGRAQ